MDKRKIGEMAMALLSPKVYGEYRKERRTEEQAASKNEAALFRMLLQDRLATDRGMALEGVRSQNRQQEFNARKLYEDDKAAQNRDFQTSKAMYENFNMTADEFSSRSQTPHWVPRGRESQYVEAKKFYSDDEIKKFIGK